MAASYTKAERARARATDGVLVTVSAGGLEYRGSVPADAAEPVVQLVFELRRRERAAAAKASEKAPTEDAV